jgi:hypothetical protein
MRPAAAGIGSSFAEDGFRLERFGAGRCMDFERSGPLEIAAAIIDEIARPAANVAVDAGGTGRAAKAIAELL